MKKSLLALAVLGAYAGVASAQSSVTVFGVVDLSVNQIKNGDAKTTSMQSNQLNSNRLGFRGFEDMGGGLGAGFWLEAGMNNEGGNVGGANGNAGRHLRRASMPLAMASRRFSIVVRPSACSAKRAVNFASAATTPRRSGTWRTSMSLAPTASPTAPPSCSLSNPAGPASGTGVRANNTIGYLLPGNLGGFYGQIQYALGQGNDNNKYWGARGGFAAGPFDFALGYGETDTANADKFKVLNLGGSWNFGFMKLFALVQQAKFSSLKQDFWELSVGVPLGQGEFRAMYGSAWTTRARWARSTSTTPTPPSGACSTSTTCRSAPRSTAGTARSTTTRVPLVRFCLARFLRIWPATRPTAGTSACVTRSEDNVNCVCEPPFGAAFSFVITLVC